MKIRTCFIVVLVLLLAFASYLFRISQERWMSDFPGTEKHSDNKMQLYLFFSENNCSDCLRIIGVLNQLSEFYQVYGVIPDRDLKDKERIKRKVGAVFPLVCSQNFKSYVPYFAPTLFGVIANKKIIFAVPTISEIHSYIPTLIERTYAWARR